MTLTADAIKVWVVNNLFIGKPRQEIEDDFKAMLKKRLIDVDDYATAMELIYGGDDDV